MIRHCAVVIALAALAGCSTPYQEMGLLGGVNATQIDSNTIQVAARGNGFTDPATVQNYVLLKAADETLAHNFDLFAIISGSDATRVGSATFSSASASNNSFWGSSFTMPVIKPGETVLIKMAKGAKPADAPPNVYDAHEVETFLGAKIKRH